MNLESFLASDSFVIFLSILVFGLTIFILPRIRENSFRFGLLDTPDYRSSHKDIVPSFGGISFFICLILTLFLTQKIDEEQLTISLIASITLMFFVGLKDDLQNLSPRKKFLGQIVAVSFLMLHEQFRIHSFHGFLGIEELNPIFSFVFSSFMLLGLINAYNLIDGIDGMASIVGIVVAATFGLLFYNLQSYYYLAICVAVVSTLFGFLRFNFSPKKKIFMGDTGSLLIGLVLGILAMKLLSLSTETFSSIAITKKDIPLFVLCILIIPAFDISRVIFIRLTRKQSVFSPDRNHIHHILIDSGLTHKQASLLIGLVNTLIIVLMYFSIKYFGVAFSLFSFFFILFTLVYAFFVLNKSYTTKRTKVKIRNFLYKAFASNKILLTKRNNFNKIVFNKKLKAIRIFFF